MYIFVSYIASINHLIIKTVDCSLIHLLSSLAGVRIWLCDAIIRQNSTKLSFLDQQLIKKAAVTNSYF